MFLEDAHFVFEHAVYGEDLAKTFPDAMKVAQLAMKIFILTQGPVFQSLCSSRSRLMCSSVGDTCRLSAGPSLCHLSLFPIHAEQLGLT